MRPFYEDRHSIPIAEVERLRAAIREHRDQRGDDRCWLDDRKLYALLPEADTADLTLPPECEFLESCRRYWAQRQDPSQGMGHDPSRMTLAELQAEAERLRAALQKIAGYHGIATGYASLGHRGDAAALAEDLCGLARTALAPSGPGGGPPT